MSSKNSVTLSVEEAWRLYELLEQMNEFLHQPDNFRRQEDMMRWLQSGIYNELRSLLYRTAATWFEVDEESGCVVPPSGIARKFADP